MKLFLTISILLLLTVLSVNAQNQRWVYHGNTDTAKYYYDANIRRAPTGILTTWEKWLKNNGSYFFVLSEFDCRQGKKRLIKGVTYSSDGKVISSADDIGDWQVPIPESIAESSLDAVCKVSSNQSKETSSNQSKNTAPITKPDFDVDAFINAPPPPPRVTNTRITEKDAGVDLARVIVKKANLRTAADINSDIVKELSQRDLLVLLSKEPIGAWYNVIDFETGEEGWIHGNNIETQFTNERRKSTLNLSRTTASRSDISPYIVISNDSEHILYLKFGASRYVIEPSAKSAHLVG